MRVLLSTYGSRGDVEPVAALALRLRALGAEIRVCAPPDKEFTDLLARAGVAATAVGHSPEYGKLLARLGVPGAARPDNAPGPDVPQRTAEMLGAAFSAIAAAAEGCDAIVAYGRTHFAAWSAARKLGIRCYVYAIFSPVALPSRAQWDLDVQRTNAQLARRSAFTGRRSGCPLTTPATTSSPAGRG